jgi:uncharacterized membrane protein
LKNNKIIIITIIFILVIAFFMRLIQLGDGLWLDEIITYDNYARLPFFEIVTRFDSENQHFLYSILAQATFILLGESTAALRLPAVIFGVASIFGIFLLVNYVSNRTEALLSATLMAFSYHHIWFSQNARGYTGMLFWTIISSYFLLRGLDRGRLTDWIFFAVSSALGTYTHLTMGFVIVGQLIVVLCSNYFRYSRKTFDQWKWLLTGFFLSGVLTLILYAPVIDQIREVIGGSEASVVTEWKSPIWTLREIIAGLNINFQLATIGFIALAILIIGLISYWKVRWEIVGLFLLPPLIGASITLIIGHHLWPRFFFFALGFGVMVLIRGVMVTAEYIGSFLKLPHSQRKYIGVLFSIGLIIVSALSIPGAYGPKQNYEAAIEYIHSHAVPDDSIATVSVAAFPLITFYKQPWIELDSVASLEQLRSSDGATWIIFTFPEVLVSVQPEIAKIITTDFQEIINFPGTVASGTIYIVRAE